MTASRRLTLRFSVDKPVTSDLARLDAHIIAAHEYDEAPDLSKRDPSEGVPEIAGEPVHQGRPAKLDSKLKTTP